jgi:hypothetical protein
VLVVAIILTSVMSAESIMGSLFIYYIKFISSFLSFSFDILLMLLNEVPRMAVNSLYVKTLKGINFFLHCINKTHTHVQSHKLSSCNYVELSPS